MKNLNLLSYVCVLLGAMLMAPGMAYSQCKMSKPGSAEYFIAPETQSMGQFGIGSNRGPAPVVVDRCQGDSGRYLMLTTGIVRPSMVSDVSNIIVDGKMAPSYCSIDGVINSPAKEEDGIIFTAQQQKALRLCTYIRVQDTARAPVDFRPQPNCKITRIEGGILNLEGDFCFLRIRSNNQFNVAMALKEECKNPKFLKDNGVEPQDLNVALNLYVAGDDTGRSTEVNPLGSVPSRIYIQPHSDLISLNDEMAPETPRFVSEFAGEIQMGDLKISGANRTFFFEPYVFFDNYAPKNCKAGVCTSPSNFNVPFAGEFEFHEVLSGGKTHFIDSWWAGTIVKPQWKGLLRLQSHALEESVLTEGKRYQLTLTMIDPSEDFYLFISDFTQFLVNLNNILGTAGIDSLTGIDGIAGLNGLPGTPALPSLPSTDLNASLNQVITALQRLGKNRDWPGYYDKVCSLDRKTCVSAGKNKHYIKLVTEFTLGALDPETGVYSLKDIVVKRDSSILPNYSRTLSHLPTLRCEEGAW